MDKIFQRRITNCLARIQEINETLQEKYTNKSLTNKDLIYTAQELLYLSEDAQQYAMEEIERQILYTYEKINTSCYTELLNYYSINDKWNLDVIEKMLKAEKINELPFLNLICQDNKKYLTLIAITAIESNLETWNINLDREDALKSLKHYSKLIMSICPDEIKQDTINSLDNIKKDLIDLYKDEQERFLYI